MLKIQKIKVLIIDNNPAFLNVFAKLLEIKGFDVTAETLLKTGLKHLEKKSFPVVFVDAPLDNYTENQILTSLAKKHVFKNSNVFLFSSVELDEIVLNQWKKEGLYSYLKKPVDRSTIMEALSEVRSKIHDDSHISGEIQDEEATPEQVAKLNQLQKQIRELESLATSKLNEEPESAEESAEDEEATPEQVAKLNQLQKQIRELESLATSKLNEEPEAVPREEPEAVPREEPEAVPREEPEAVPREEPEAVPREEPEAVPREEPEAVPREEPEAVPREEPEAVPREEPEAVPREEPEAVPREEPEAVPREEPEAVPREEPEAVPREEPEAVPREEPEAVPREEPEAVPREEPEAVPREEPEAVPREEPEAVPREEPEAVPREEPEAVPREEPEAVPREEPEAVPREEPEAVPREEPEAVPREEPEAVPREEPEAVPREEPEAVPREEPEAVPREEPEAVPREEPEAAEDEEATPEQVAKLNQLQKQIRELENILQNNAITVDSQIEEHVHVKSELGSDNLAFKNIIDDLKSLQSQFESESTHLSEIKPSAKITIEQEKLAKNKLKESLDDLSRLKNEITSFRKPEDSDVKSDDDLLTNEKKPKVSKKSSRIGTKKPKVSKKSSRIGTKKSHKTRKR